jgi:phenylacetate-CoA ligase
MKLDEAQRQRLKSLSRSALREYQLNKLNALLQSVLPTNRFYAAKFAGLPQRLNSLDQMAQWPFTTKDELVADEPSGLARHLTFAPEQYCRFHRTSGTHGRPISILDTADDWQWWIETWQYVLDGAGIGAHDRAVMAFSFGPFIGFWSAHDAVVARGAMSIPTGGMSSLARLDLILSLNCTAVFCTPSYALHLAEVARREQIDLRPSAVRAIVVAGEPGGSIPSFRERVEAAWNATVFDHCGATEVGPWGFADKDRRGIVMNEAEFIAEFQPVPSTAKQNAEPLHELVLTNLGRVGAPVIRYRTGDLVRPVFAHADPSCRWMLLDGGVLGRVDDMIMVRGVNIYPSSVEQIVREFPDVDEFRLVVRKRGSLDHLTVEVEDRAHDTSRIAERMNLRLGLNVDVVGVPLGSLPRSEFKSRRFVDLRNIPGGQA